MEFRLLKTIEATQRTLLPKETLPRLTAYPANNCVNPGLGQIARLYSFYVPLYSNRNLHSISKNAPDVDAVDQEGSGIDPQEEQKNDDQFSTDNDIHLNPVAFNEKKRKLLGSAVQESFLHPKVIKTNKIIFSKDKNEKVADDSKTKQSKTMQSKNPPKLIKHKFQFI